MEFISLVRKMFPFLIGRIRTFVENVNSEIYAEFPFLRGRIRTQIVSAIIARWNEGFHSS